MFSRLHTPILLIKQIERKKVYFSWKAIIYIEASECIWTIQTIQPSFRLCKPHFRFVDLEWNMGKNKPLAVIFLTETALVPCMLSWL